MNLEIETSRRFRLDIQKFDIEARNNLPTQEKKLLSLLERAAEAGARVYAAQVNDRYPGANFYPHDASKEEIEQASKDNLDILDPYTVVKRNLDGSLFTIPYHKAYQAELSDAVLLIRDTSRVAELEQAYHLLSIAQALGLGYYERVIEEWMSMSKEPTIDAVIGFYDRYTDRLLNRKYSFQAWVGILNREETYKAQEVVDEILDVWQTQGPKPEGFKVPKMKVRIDQTTIFSGQAARYDWSANSLPCQREWREKYGSKFTVFQSAFEDKLIHDRLPLMKELFEYDPQTDMSKEELLEAALIYYFAHEICHALIRKPGDEERLGAMYSPFSEGFCTALGMQLVKDLRTPSNKAKAFVAHLHLTNTVAEAIASTRGVRQEYALADRVIFNFLMSQKTFNIKNGYLRLSNWEKVYASLPPLVLRLDAIAEKGKSGDFEELVTTYGVTKELGSLNPIRKLRLHPSALAS